MSTCLFVYISLIHICYKNTWNKNSLSYFTYLLPEHLYRLGNLNVPNNRYRLLLKVSSSFPSYIWNFLDSYISFYLLMSRVFRTLGRKGGSEGLIYYWWKRSQQWTLQGWSLSGRTSWKSLIKGVQYDVVVRKRGTLTGVKHYVTNT